MQTKHPQRDPQDQQSILQAYSIFESNQSYQNKFTAYKKKIQNSDHHFIIIIVRALRLILSTGGKLGTSEIIASQKLAVIKNTKEIILNEYSKLLALRFIRETYFDSNYLYMTHVHLFLSSILLKIALFQKESTDEERGKHLFAQDSRVFQGESKFAQGREKELEVIGFSVHKITLEIMFGSRDFVKCLPYHQEFQIQENQSKQSLFLNQMYTGYLLLKENRVKFPTKLHYFKEKDVAKYTAYYQKNSNSAQIRDFYLKIFEEVWVYLSNANGPVSALGFISTDATFLNIQNEVLQQKLIFCGQLVLETCDRYFWKYFNEFTAKRLSQIMSLIEKGQSINEKQMKDISNIFLFLMFFSYHLLQPQIFYVIEHNYIEKMAYLFVIIMRSFGRNGQDKQKKAISGCVLIFLIDCFTKLKQISVKFVNAFSQKNINHNYQLISFYSDIVMQIDIVGSKIPLFAFSTELERNIIDRMNKNHEFHFKKQQFIFHFYEKKQQTKKKEPKEGVVTLFKEVMTKYSKYLRTKPRVSIQQMVEEVTIEKQEITKEELQITHSDKFSSIRSSFRLRVVSSQKNQLTPQKQSIPSVKSAITLKKSSNDDNVPSFIQSLKVKINRPNDELVKSLSSSRKLRRGNSNDSNSNFKSFRSNDHSDNSQTSLFLSKTNAIAPFSTPPQFKYVFIDNSQLPVFQQPLESRPSIRKNPSKMQRISRVNDMANTKYINNFIEERKEAQTKKIREDYYEQTGTEVKEKQFQRKVETEYMPFVEQKTQKIQSLTSMSSLDKLSFYFTPKAKKELLKKKVLIRKNTRFQIGMIANLQEEISANQTQTVRKYLLLIKVYITTFLPMARVTVDIKMPNWLECISKANLSKEGLKEQTQIISNFVVMLKASKQHVPNRNYGEMPTLSVVWTDKSDKKEAISQPLYILLNRFAIEKVVTQSEFNQTILGSLTINDPLPVHEKISTDLKSMKNYYSTLSIFPIDISQKMQIFSSMDNSISDQLGVVKLEFIRNHQELMLIFFQGDRGKPKLFVQFRPLKPQKWNYEQLHIFETCLRSIMRADQ